MTKKLDYGQKLGDWVIQKPLGVGGMGSVYLAHSALSSKVRCALKVMGNASGMATRARFVQELDILASLNHPAIVRTLGGGHDDGRDLLYLTMELVDGEDLTHRLQRGPLSPAEVYNLFRQLGDGLQHAHERGVAHRDIKPSNLMITSSGQARIVDFGIARATDGTRLTQEGLLPGTIAYVDPMAFGDQLPNPFQADVYALGLVMWECLTGRRAFHVAPNLEPSTGIARLINEKTNSKPFDPGPGFPEGLRRLVMATTQPDASQRIPDMAAFVTQLHQAYSGPASLNTAHHPTPAHSATQSPAASEPKTRTPWLGIVLGFGLATLGCLGVTLMGGALLWLNMPQTPISHSSDPTPTPQPIPLPHPTLPSGAEDNIAFSFGTQGSARGELDDARWIGVDSANNLYTVDFQDGRAQRFLRDGTLVWEVTIPPDDTDMYLVEGMAVAPNGPMYISRRGDILVLNIADGSLQTVWPGVFSSKWYEDLEIRKNGEILALLGSESLSRLSPQGQTLQRWDDVISSHNRRDSGMTMYVAEGPSGDIYISSGFGNQLYHFDEKGNYIGQFGDGETSYGPITVDDQNRIYVETFGEILVLQADGTQTHTIPTRGLGAIRDLTTDGDGHLWTVTSSGTVIGFSIP